MAVSAEEQKYLKSNQGSVVNHAEWKKEKKKYKIEDTIKGVDIGKELDKFHAACKKGVKASVDAGKVLQKKVALYKKDMDKGHPDWAKRTDYLLEEAVKKYIDDAEFFVKNGRARA